MTATTLSMVASAYGMGFTGAHGRDQLGDVARFDVA